MLSADAGLLVLFGSVRQIKLAVRQLLSARKYSASYRISYRTNIKALLSIQMQWVNNLEDYSKS